MIFPTTSPTGLSARAALFNAVSSCDDDTAARADPDITEAMNLRRETAT
ncbi:hypothetical protein ACFQX6_02910 [Streptosporangium lutulentum]